MPPQNNTNQPSPFEITTPKKSKKIGQTGIIVGSLIGVFLVLSVVAGVLLVKQQQTLTPQAAANTCPGAEACPYTGSGYPSGYDLMNCHVNGGSTGESDKSPQESLCNTAGRVEVCGPSLTNYCCPKVGGVWTTDMTACNVNPTPTPTVAPTATPTLTPTPTPTATATPGAGNSCNGTCGSNSNCESGLYCYSGSCRNPLCADDSTCGCGVATATPTATPTAAPGATAAPVTQATSLPIPVTGTDWPTVAGAGVGVGAIVVSLLLAL